MTLVLTRATKQAARYTDAGGRERCSGCRFFMPQGTCGRIIGPVSPRGWCKYFSMEATQKYQPGMIPTGGPAPPSLLLDFAGSPGTLDPRITFTRASVGTYFDSSGVLQTAPANTARFDYHPITHVSQGLLIEEARTNVLLNSGDVSNASWTKTSAIVTVPVATGNVVVSPAGTTTGCQIDFPAVSGAAAFCNVTGYAGPATNAPYSISIWLRGNVGGEQVYLNTTPDGSLYYRTLCTLTTAWQRFVLNTPSLNGATWYVAFGVDLRDAGQSSKSAQRVFAWGGQIEAGAFASSYIPTTGAAVTRSADQCYIASSQMGFYVSPGGSWAVEFIDNTTTAGNRRILLIPPSPASYTAMYVDTTFHAAQYNGTGPVASANVVTTGVVSKSATTIDASTGRVCLNAGAIASGAMTGGYPTAVTSGIQFMVGATPSTEDMTGYLRRVRYWPRVLSDAEMQSVTT